MVGREAANRPPGRWGEALRGALAVLPLALANVPFALAYALGAAAAGLSSFQAVALSLLVFAGSAQFVSVGLIGTGAGPLGLAGAVFLVNLRHILLGAAVAPSLEGVGLRGRAALAYGLTDEAFAVSIRPLESGASPAFLVGAEVGLFFVWQGAVAAAAWLGTGLQLPAWVPLDMVLPLCMLALLVAVARGGHDYMVAATAAVVAAATALAGAAGWAPLAGIVAGALLGALASGTARAPAGKVAASAEDEAAGSGAPGSAGSSAGAGADRGADPDWRSGAGADRGAGPGRCGNVHAYPSRPDPGKDRSRCSSAGGNPRADSSRCSSAGDDLRTSAQPDAGDGT